MLTAAVGFWVLTAALRVFLACSAPARLEARKRNCRRIPRGRSLAGDRPSLFEGGFTILWGGCWIWTWVREGIHTVVVGSICPLRFVVVFLACTRLWVLTHCTAHFLACSARVQWFWPGTRLSLLTAAVGFWVLTAALRVFLACSAPARLEA